MPALFRPIFRASLLKLREDLGDSTFEEETRRGAAMAPHAVSTYALGEVDAALERFA